MSRCRGGALGALAIGAVWMGGCQSHFDYINASLTDGEMKSRLAEGVSMGMSPDQVEQAIASWKLEDRGLDKCRACERLGITADEEITVLARPHGISMNDAWYGTNADFVTFMFAEKGLVAVSRYGSHAQGFDDSDAIERVIFP